MNFSVLSILIGYFLGAIPTSFIAGKLLAGIDLREHGSGNLGASNTARILGKGPGIMVLILDVLKGVAAVLLISRLLPSSPYYYQVLSGFLAIIGHNWSIFLNFSGGKGVATSSGVLLALTPKITLVLLGVFAVIVAITRYISLGSLIAAILFPVLVFYFKGPLPLFIFSIVVAMMILVRHKANIQRLLAGTENKIGDKSKDKKENN